MGLNAPHRAALELIIGIDFEIERGANRQIGLHGRIKAHEQQLDCILKRHCRIEGPHQNRAAIFGFTDLEKRRVDAGLYKIPLGVDQKQRGRPRCNLASHDQRGLKGAIGLLTRLRMARDHLAQGLPHHARHLKHRRLLVN